MKKNNTKGFTLIELIVAVAIFITLFSLSWIIFTTLPSRNSNETSILTLLADMRSQQTQAMTGLSAQNAQSDYGIYFGGTYYTLFTGTTYVPGKSSNFEVDLGDVNLAFTNITFPGSVIVFSRGSGEIENYVAGNDEISILNKSNNTTTTLKINKYGATY